MKIEDADLVQLSYALDISVARNEFTGIVRSAAIFENTLHSCFTDNTVSDASCFPILALDRVTESF